MVIHQPIKAVRGAHSIATQITRIPFLPSNNIEVFRASAFQPSKPAQLPKGHFSGLPAVDKWFSKSSTGNTKLNTGHLRQYGEVFVPLEFSRTTGNLDEFERINRPLLEFLDHIEEQQLATSRTCSIGNTELADLRIYLAQCSLSTLPPHLLEDIPTPNLVLESGRGDIYDSSIWIGRAPTYTPLHKDPNPNLFVQLAGEKVVRLFEPRVGRELYEECQRRIGARTGSEFVRGEEMMRGEEKRILHEMIWGNGNNCSKYEHVAMEGAMEAGDAMFIPKGWWHSIKGVGKGIVGSVNWWFR